jgi:hypothetical protein
MGKSSYVRELLSKNQRPTEKLSAPTPKDACTFHDGSLSTASVYQVTGLAPVLQRRTAGHGSSKRPKQKLGRVLI